MDEKNLKVFNAIFSFVQDLHNGFGKAFKSVALYNRLIGKTTIRDSNAIKRHIKAFQTFFDNNSEYIKEKKLTSNAKIVYSDRVYIDIGQILSKADHDSQSQIYKHFATIYSLVNLGTRQGREALENLSTEKSSSDKVIESLNIPNTAEGAFIKDTMAELTDHFKGIQLDENPNPMVMMTSMMSSGFFTNFMGNMQKKFSSGELDLKGLMSTMTTIISDVAPQNSEEGQQLRNFIDSSSTLTGNTEIKELLEKGPKGDVE